MDIIAELAYVTTVGGIAAGYASVFRYLLEYLCAGVSASFGTTVGGGTCCMGLVADAFPWSAGTQNVVSCAHAAVQSLSAPDADGVVMATATLPKGAWSAGAVAVTASVQGARQNLVLPNTAVRQDNQGQYVLAVEEKNTILGLQNVLVRLSVTVLETGDSTVAVSGALDSQTRIVVSSSKSVQAGDTVRLQDES